MPPDWIEREVKLEAGVGFRVPALDDVFPGVEMKSQAEQRLYAVYVDTPDLRLLRSGLTLRHRSERGSSPTTGEWTLKLPAPQEGQGLSRREMNWPGKWGPVPKDVAMLVRAYRRTAPLGPVARLVTHRRRYLLQDRGQEPLLEIDDDVVSVMDGRRLAARFREVEIEVVGDAPITLLDAVVDRMAEAGAVRAGGVPKLVRAIGPRASEPPDVVPVPVDRDSTMGETVRAAIAQGYLRLVDHDLGVRLDEDPEDVHQARVATRRLRSDLKTFRAFLPDDWTDEIREELGWVAAALGKTRDADVMLERLHEHVESLEPADATHAGRLVSQLVTERDRDRRELLEVMESERYGRLLDRLAAAAQELPPVKGPERIHASAEAPAPVQMPTPAQPAVGSAEAWFVPPAVPAPELAEVAPPEPDRDSLARKVAPSIVSRPWKHVSRAVDALGPEPADDALHQVRIRAKRLRYACEAVAPVAGKPATEMARAAANLQGILGDFHDAVVAEDWIRQASTQASTSQALAAGQLIAQERLDAAQLRDGWGGAWKKLNRKKLRNWMH